MIIRDPPYLHAVDIKKHLGAMKHISALVYSVAGGMQVYYVTNYSTCCFLLHLQLSKNYIKERVGLNIPNKRILTMDKQTSNNCDLVI